MSFYKWTIQETDYDTKLAVAMGAAGFRQGVLMRNWRPRRRMQVEIAKGHLKRWLRRRLRQPTGHAYTYQDGYRDVRILSRSRCK